MVNVAARNRSGPSFPPSNLVYPSTTKPGFYFIDFWVTSQGIDTNKKGHGLSPGCAFSSLQYAVDHINANYVFGKVQPYIKYRPGTYPHNLELADALTGTQERGGGPIAIVGNFRTGGFWDLYNGVIGDVVLDTSSMAKDQFSILMTGQVVVHFLSSNAHPSYHNFYSTLGGTLEVGSIQYGSGAIKEFAENKGNIVCTGGVTCTVGGTALRMAKDSNIYVVGTVHSFINNPSFSQGVHVVTGRSSSISHPNTIGYSGSVTGAKANISRGGTIYTENGGASLPGSSPIIIQNNDGYVY